MPSGRVTFFVGGHQPTAQSAAMMGHGQGVGATYLTGTLTVDT